MSLGKGKSVPKKAFPKTQDQFGFPPTIALHGVMSNNYCYE